MLPYFEQTPLDHAFYAEYLRPRLPTRIFDVHVHLNLPDHVAMVPPERWLSDWALECGHLLPVEDAYACAGDLFPDAEYAIAGMPWPIREADLAARTWRPTTVIWPSSAPRVGFPPSWQCARSGTPSRSSGSCSKGGSPASSPTRKW
jgi:hypothetical protein